MQTDNGFQTSGMCVTANKCLAQSTGGKAPDSGLSQLMSALGQILGKLASGSGSGSPSSSPTPTTGSTGCTTAYYYTANTSVIGVDPCAIYQPSSGTTCTDPTATNYGAAAACTYGTSTGSSTSASSLLSALIGSTGTGSTGDSLTATPASGAAPLMVTFTTNSIDSTQSYTVTPGDGGTAVNLSANGCSSASSATCVYVGSYTYQTAGTFSATLTDEDGDSLASVSVSVENPGGGTGLSQVLSNIGNFLAGSSTLPQNPLQSSSNFPGVLGNILLDQNGATIFASTVNGSNNSETSGFYGSDTLGGEPQGTAAQLCVNRPWASNFLADIIPPLFFDSLCQWGGYQVGQPPAQPQVTLQQSSQAPTQPAPTPVATSTPTAPAQAQIWSVPSAVPLGARTSVFWNTQGVVSCTETSPDGSFSEGSLSGAASTVPLTGSTTFTISCVDANGNPITNYTTVTISS